MSADNDFAVRNAIELTLIPGIGTLTQNRIWKAVPDIADLFSMADKSLQSVGVPAEACSAIRCRSYQAIASEICDWGLPRGLPIFGAGQSRLSHVAGGNIQFRPWCCMHGDN